MTEKRVAHQQKNGIRRFYDETVGELKKVNWPTRQEATNLTTIVLIVIAAMAIFLGVLDILITRFFGLLMNV